MERKSTFQKIEDTRAEIENLKDALEVCKNGISKKEEELKQLEENYKERLYVVVSNKLEPVYACVQGAHAVAQYLIEHLYEGDSWKNKTLVFLYTDRINIFNNMLNNENIKHSCFREPDLNNELTAIAVYKEDIEKASDYTIENYIADLKTIKVIDNSITAKTKRFIRKIKRFLVG